MSVYRALDPDLAWKAIEGHEDVVSTEARALDAFYRQFSCPRCKCQLTKQFDTRTAFNHSEGTVAHALLICGTCGYLMDPHTNLVLNSGNPSKMPVRLSPIWLPDED
jgi:RNase P subunit RPR2